MKVLFDARIHLNYYSGISRYIICLLEAYLRNFKEDEVIVLINESIEKDNSIFKKLKNYSNIEFKVVSYHHMGPVNYTKMGKLIKEISPDIYHYPHIDAPVFIGNTPLVVTIHDVNSKNNIKKFNDRFGIKSIYFKIALKWTLKRADRITFVSESVLIEVLLNQNITKSSRHQFIYNGLESNFNEVSKEDITNTINKFNIDTPYILYVGQIRTHKNIERSIEAFNRFQLKNSKYKLVIVGHNYLNLDLSHNHIIQIDEVTNKELKSLYAQCSSFIFPSLFEGFGFPILEAFSFGKPVITSNYGATKEISHGKAILVNPLDVSSIEKGIEKSIIDDFNNAELISHAQSFSWTEHVINLRQVYLDAINERK